MNNKIPFVSVIVPCRDEEKLIKRMMSSIVSQNYPKENLEVLVIDGISKDKTKDIIKEFIKNYSFIRILENKEKFTPFALNIGINESKGKIIVRADAHTEYPQNYISRCVEELLKHDEKERIGNVGGTTILPPENGLKEIKERFEANNPGKKYNIIIAKSIALCLSSPFGAASAFRIGAKKSTFVDTVFGGCYKREALDNIKEKTYFNEKLTRSQDLELNLRLIKKDWKILLIPDINFYYYPEGDFLNFLKHNFNDGIWSIYPLKFTKKFFKLRHYIPLFFILSLIFSFFLSLFVPKILNLFFFIVTFYFLINLYFSYKISIRTKSWKFLFLMPIAFLCRI